MLRGFLVSGTDTEIGKTRVSAALLHRLAGAGLRTAALKPVAAGTEVINCSRVNEDVRTLRDASSVQLSYTQVGPCQLDLACAPHIAALEQGICIDRSALLRAAQDLAAHADVIVVEGVGGFCVPLGPDWDTADLAVDLALPVVLVVGLRLGCLNHALLTASAICERGLTLAGWVANTVGPMSYSVENVNALRHEFSRRWAAPCLGVIPRLDDPHPAAVARYLDLAPLDSLLG